MSFCLHPEAEGALRPELAHQVRHPSPAHPGRHQGVWRQDAPQVRHYGFVLRRLIPYIGILVTSAGTRTQMTLRTVICIFISKVLQTYILLEYGTVLVICTVCRSIFLPYLLVQGRGVWKGSHGLLRGFQELWREWITSPYHLPQVSGSRQHAYEVRHQPIWLPGSQVYPICLSSQAANPLTLR